VRWNIFDRRTRLELVGLLILVAGLGLAVAIDLTATDEPVPALGYEVDSDSAQPVRPDDSKQYLRSMEMYNGKTGVLLYELRMWFAGLWRGRALARTLYCLTAAASALVFLVARRLPPDSGSDSPRE